MIYLINTVDFLENWQLRFFNYFSDGVMTICILFIHEKDR